MKMMGLSSHSHNALCDITHSYIKISATQNLYRPTQK